jgi:hypothetical protein
MRREPRSDVGGAARAPGGQVPSDDAVERLVTEHNKFAIAEMANVGYAGLREIGLAMKPERTRVARVGHFGGIVRRRTRISRCTSLDLVWGE